MISSLELARICGVSQGTVDRAIHHRTGIGEATRQRILKAAAAHGYSPNPAAREIMTGKSRMVGALTPVTNSVFFMDLLQCIKESLAPQGLRVLLATVNTPEEFQEMIGEFAARRMRAAIVVPPEEGMVISSHVTRDMKVVSLLSPLRGDSAVCFVAPDEVATGKKAVQYLARKGHRRILHLTYWREAMAIRDRARGYEEGMVELGEAPVILRDLSRPILAKAIEKYRPTALFCHNDPLALNVIRILGELDLRVPRDVSVMGVDNSPTFRFLYPDLTTMAYPRERIAVQVTAWISGNKKPRLMEGCRIVEGQTIRKIHSHPIIS
ncbi:MAG: LacI family DNA-binding transcriptional regulator [Verrucomicrobiae bacterium]|nr:LacI family DNA-binding transcriptional regulator [Verrucomicrobiae bacterium]